MRIRSGQRNYVKSEIGSNKTDRAIRNTVVFDTKYEYVILVHGRDKQFSLKVFAMKFYRRPNLFIYLFIFYAVYLYIITAPTAKRENVVVYVIRSIAGMGPKTKIIIFEI